MRLMKWLLHGLFLVLVIGAVGHSRGALDRLRDRRPIEAEPFPSARMGRILSVGYSALVGDWWWVKTINFYGSALMFRRDERKFTERIQPVREYLAATTAIDPFVREAFYFGGVVLGWDRKDAKSGVWLMRRGLQSHPEDWKMWYYLSFNHFYFLKEFKEAADALLRGTLLPTAPVFFIGLADKLVGHEDFMRMALEYLGVAWSETKDPQKKEEISEKMKEYGTRLIVAELQEAVDRFKQERGRWPGSLDQLVRAGTIAEIPADPRGGRFYMDPSHRVRNSSLPD